MPDIEQLSVPASLNLGMRVFESESATVDSRTGLLPVVELWVYLLGPNKFSENPRILILNWARAAKQDQFNANALTEALADEIKQALPQVDVEAADLLPFAKKAAAKANLLLAGLSSEPIKESARRNKLSQAVYQLLT